MSTTEEMSTNEDLIGRDDVNDLEAILADHQHRRRRGRPRGEGQRRRHLHVGLREGCSARRSTSSTRRPRPRSGTARPTWTGRSTSTRRRSSPPTPPRTAVIDAEPRPHRHAVRATGATRSGCELGDRVAELDAVASSCTASRARWSARPRSSRPCRGSTPSTTPSTQVMDEARHVEVFAKYLDTKLSGHYPINAHLQAAARRHHRGQPLGHDLPRHADHGRGPGPGRLRVHAPAHHRAAAQAAAALRDERRGPPRGLRRAVAEGVLRRADRRRDPRAPGVRLRGRRAHARPLPAAGGLGAHGRRPPKEAMQAHRCRRPSARCSSSCCSRRSCPNCKKLGLLDAGDGWLRERFDEIGVIQFEDWVDTGEEYEALDEVAKDRAAAEAA